MGFQNRCIRLTAASASEAVISGRCPLDSLNGKHGLAQVIPTGCQGVPKSLPDDVLKVRVHAYMRAQPAAKEKPHPRGGAKARLVRGASQGPGI